MRRLLLSTTATSLLLALATGVAFAQQSTDVGRIKVEGTAEDAPGGGYIIPEDSPRERSTVTQQAIERQPASSSVFQLLGKSPGVNFGSNDPTGLFGGQLSIRGFNSDEIGFTIAGVPVNDSGNGAVYPQEFIDPENVQEIGLAQAAADTDQPQGFSVGGSVNIIIRRPTDEPGVRIVQSLGEFNFYKSFGRVDTGLIAGLPLKAFVSYSKAETDKFRGEGGANRDHVDFGLDYAFDNGSTIKVNSLFNSAINQSFRTVTLADFRRYGRNYDYDSVGYALPAGVNGTAQNEGASFTGPTNTGVPYSTNRGNFYQLRVNPFNNEIASLDANLVILDNLTIDIQPYYWNGYGNGGGYATLSEAANATSSNNTTLYVPNGLDLNKDGDKLDTVAFYRPSITSTQRPGVNSKVTYTPVEWDSVNFGVNFDHSRHHQTQPFEKLNPDGSAQYVFADQNVLTRPDGSIVQGRDQLTFNDTIVAYIQNTLTLFDDRLKFVASMRRQTVSRDGNNYLPTVLATGNNLAIHPSYEYLNYLPGVNGSFQIDENNQVYAALQKNARAPSNYTLYESVTTALGFSAIGSQIQETAWNLDLGYRYKDENVLAYFNLFGTNFQNRQVNYRLTDDPNGPTNDINAGSVHDRGFDIEVGTSKPFYDVSAYATASYNKSILQSNLPLARPTGGTAYLPISGKTYPNAPRWLISMNLEYAPKRLFDLDTDGFYVGATPKYTGSRYSTLANDEKLDSYTTVDLYAGYKFPDGFGLFKSASIQLNATNIFNDAYLFTGNSASNSAGINAQAIRTTSGIVIPGQSVSYTIGAPRFFSVRLQADF